MSLETNHIEAQKLLRAKRENQEIELYALRDNILKSCQNLKKHFEHNMENIENMIAELDKSKIDFESLDSDYLDYLIRDHGKYSEILREISELNNYHKLIENYQATNTELDY